jgi:Protein of unknown function (DUF2911)
MTKNSWFGIALLLALVISGPAARAQQDKSKRPSPPAKTDCSFTDGKTVHIDYSSPRIKGRKIFGGLVPYDQAWRTGANEATTFVIDTNLMVGDQNVPAGSYTLFTVPSEKTWTLIVSKKTGEWGTPYPGEADDLVRAKMKASQFTPPVENMTIDLKRTGDVCTLSVSWDQTLATIGLVEKK